MLIKKQLDTKKAIGQDNIPAEAIKENISMIAPIGQLNLGILHGRYCSVIIYHYSNWCIFIDFSATPGTREEIMWLIDAASSTTPPTHHWLFSVLETSV